MVSFRDCRVDCRRERLRGRLKIIRTLPCLTGKSRDKPQISQIAQNLPAGSGRAIIRNPPLRAAVFAARQSQEEGDCLPLRGTEGGGMSAARHFSARYGKEQTHKRRKTYNGGDMRHFLVLYRTSDQDQAVPHGERWVRRRTPCTSHPGRYVFWAARQPHLDLKTEAASGFRRCRVSTLAATLVR